MSDRPGHFGRTILSGDLAVGNAHHVVVFDNVGSGQQENVLDGFSIRDGDANTIQHSFADKGGGLLVINSVVRLENCAIRDNYAQSGAGLCVLVDSLEQAEVGVLTCSFRNNVAGIDGGGIYVEQVGGAVSFEIYNTTIKGNEAVLGDGGGVWLGLESCDSIRMGNIVAHDNEADRGGALFVRDVVFNGACASRFEIGNCTIAYNTARALNGGAGVWAGTLSALCVVMGNSIVTGNEAGGVVDGINGPSYNPNVSFPCQGFFQVEYSNVQVNPPAVHAGTGNLNTNPMFVNSALRNLTLTSNSPMCDAGSDDLIPLDVLDMDDNPATSIAPYDRRLFVRQIQNPMVPDTGLDTSSGGGVPNAITDIGAYEYDPSATPGQ